MHYEQLRKRNRWRESSINWSAESKEILARIELKRGSEERSVYVCNHEDNFSFRKVIMMTRTP